MPRRPLNPRGGDAARIETRITDDDLDRLIALAKRRNIKSPVLIRLLIQQALDAAETEELEQAS